MDYQDQNIIPKRKISIDLYWLFIPLVVLWVGAQIFGLVDYEYWLSPLVIILSFLFVLIIAEYYRRQTWKNSWEELAMGEGLSLQTHGAKIPLLSKYYVAGTFRGHQVTLDTFTRQMGRNRVTYTRIEFRMSEASGYRLVLSPRGLLGISWGQAGLEEVRLGEEGFDRKIAMRSNQAALTRKALGPLRLRAGLLQLRAQARSLTIKIEQQALYFHERGLVRDEAYLRAVMDLLVELAGSVERAAT